MSKRKNNFTDTFSKIGINIDEIDDEPTILNRTPNQLPDKNSISRSIAYIERRAKKINDSISKIRKDKNTTSDEIVTILEQTELLRREIRIVATNIPDMTCRANIEHVIAVLSGVSVSSPSGTYLKIELYPLMSLPLKGGYNVYFEVKDAVSQYISSHDISFPQNQRYTLVYRRVTTAELVLAKGRCDNDNFEMRRVTNAISDAIGIADSVDKFSFFYTTVQGLENKTDVFLLPEIDPLSV